MSIVRVAVPVLHGRRRFHFDKGRPWSIIEHALLYSLKIKEATTANLSERGNIPQRVVIEALIRLMRAGWVEMMERNSGVIFRITDNGVVAVSSEELPNAPRRLSRNMNFVVDQISGTVYRSRELPFYHEYVIRERAEKERIIWIQRPERPRVDEVRPLVEALFMDDEKFISMDHSGDRLSERWSLVTVRDDKPDGLPHQAPTTLVEAVKLAAKQAPDTTNLDKFVSYPSLSIAGSNMNSLLEKRRVDISAKDLVLGGPDHKAVIKSALKHAKHRVLIHSTFIVRDRFIDLLPYIREALGRGVVIDVLWGQDESVEGRRSTRQAVRQIKTELVNEDLHMLRIHPFSTGSHCKVLLADEGTTDRYSAWVGSCNWLSSPFQSVETSVRLRNPEIVADVVDQMAELSKGTRGHWTDLTNNLAALSANLRSSRHSTVSGSAYAQIVVGSDHPQMVRKARDESQHRIFVSSHRFGIAGQSIVLAPALAAAKHRGVVVDVLYGTTNISFGNNNAAEITDEFSRDRVTIQPVHRPRIHAKILAWDDDMFVITSQNWLSADPPDDMPRQEIGVFVHAAGLAKILVDRFNTFRME